MSGPKGIVVQMHGPTSYTMVRMLGGSSRLVLRGAYADNRRATQAQGTETSSFASARELNERRGFG